MKQARLIKMLFVPAALSFFAACSSDNDIVGDKNSTEDKGVTLTINATAGADAAMSRVQYNNDYSVEWTSADKVYAFAGSTANAGLCGITTTADKHNAKLTVTLPTTPKNGDKITAYVANYSVTAVNAKTEGLGDQVEVDYSKQDGTYAGATSRCVLFGETTYNSESELSMNFEYQTTFLKLSLNFQDASVAGKAALYLTGDNVYSISRMNTTGDKAGKLGNQNGFTITVPSVDVAAGQTKDIYIAMYPGAVQNVKLQAVMADGKTYEFNLGNANLVAGKVYKIAKTGTKVATEASAKLEGKGTTAEPYLINNLADLKYLQKNTGVSGQIYKMTNDIVINGAWTPIEQFHGIFDGDGHSILGNIEVSTNTNNSGIGLFGNMGYNATIKNLTNKANIFAQTDQINVSVGGIVGKIYTNNVQIKNCVNKGIINSEILNTGGIVGEIVSYKTEGYQDILIEACKNEGNIITTGTRIGGIVANINGNGSGVQNIRIKGCSTTNVSFGTRSSTCYTGGILGYLQAGQSADIINITACWTSNMVFPIVGNKYGMVGAPAPLKYILNNCWTNADNDVIKGSVATITHSYKKADNKSFSEWVTEANTAWGSTEYEFNADGTINVKK
mgnify:CR=1 FL=1